MIWGGIAGLALGFVIGFAVAAEVGRIIYNRKMAEIKGQVREIRDMLDNPW